MNQHRNSKIVIIGNGPSLRKVDMSLLQKTETISFNRAFIAYEQWGFHPTYYCAIDRNAVKNDFMSISSLIEHSSISYFFLRNTYRYLGLPKSKKVSYINVGDQSCFSPNLDDLKMYWNVAAVSIQILYLIGYRKFLLLGVDGGYKINNSASETISKYDLIANEDDDHDHFTEKYHGKGIHFTRPNNEKFIDGWKSLAHDIQRMDIEIVNASLFSEVDCFRKMSFNEAWNWYKQ